MFHQPQILFTGTETRNAHSSCYGVSSTGKFLKFASSQSNLHHPRQLLHLTPGDISFLLISLISLFRHFYFLSTTSVQFYTPIQSNKFIFTKMPSARLTKKKKKSSKEQYPLTGKYSEFSKFLWEVAIPITALCARSYTILNLQSKAINFSSF